MRHTLAGLLGVVAGILFLMAVPAQASPLMLYSTGVDHNSALLAGGSVDPHYELTLPDGSLGAAYAIQSWLPAWVNRESTPQSWWISPTADATKTSPKGLYIYKTSFDLSGYDVKTMALKGTWTADNDASIWLNGVDTGTTHDHAGFGKMTPFTVTDGFSAGVNTLEFRVTQSHGGWGNPTGLRVSMESPVLATAQTTETPEPGTMLLLCVGLALAAAAGKRRNGRKV